MLHPTWLWESAGAFYASVSGWLPDVTLIGAAIGLYRGHNCHAKACWRVGTHPYEKDGVTHKLCRHCHPVLKGQRHTRREFHLRHGEIT